MASQIMGFLPLILLIVIFYFIVLRPQSQQQKKVQEMRDSMKVGDEVLTIGGFYGIIYAMDDKNVVLEMLPDFNKAMVTKNAISRVIAPEDSMLVDDDEDVEVEEGADGVQADVDSLETTGDKGEVDVVEVDLPETADENEPAVEEK